MDMDNGRSGLTDEEIALVADVDVDADVDADAHVQCNAITNPSIQPTTELVSSDVEL